MLPPWSAEKGFVIIFSFSFTFIYEIKISEKNKLTPKPFQKVEFHKSKYNSFDQEINTDSVEVKLKCGLKNTPESFKGHLRSLIVSTLII